MQASNLKSYLAASSARHNHLCPRQVLGVRLALAGAARLELSLPRHDKRLLVIVETDGCFTDGVEVAAGVSIGHRTLRVEDYGKIGATFVDTVSDRAVRIAPHPDVRLKAWRYAAGERHRYFAQLLAYQIMPENELLSFQEVCLTQPASVIVSRPDFRSRCVQCGEEIINQREKIRGDRTLCRACAGSSYYSVAASVTSICLPILSELP